MIFLGFGGAALASFAACTVVDEAPDKTGGLSGDADGDGFLDADDPAPNDPTVPGDFSTPEAILAHPLVKKALEEARGKGFEIVPQTSRNPPDISGYYFRPVGGKVEATDDDQVGKQWVAEEWWQRVDAELTLSRMEASFDGETVISHGEASGTLVRGEGNDYTLYSKGHGTCLEDGSSFEKWRVSAPTIP